MQTVDKNIINPEKFTCKTTRAAAQKAADAISKGKLTSLIFAVLVSVLWIVHHLDHKLEGIDSVSSSACDNAICKKRMKNGSSICAKCYANTQQKLEKGLKEHNILNGIILKNILFPIKTLKYLPIFSKFLRIESFGDVENVTQARNYIRIIKAFPRKRCAIWSKNLAIWAEAFRLEGKPKNATYVHSSLMINQPDTDALEKFDFIDHIFTVYDREHADKVTINCGGKKCMDCIRKKKNCYFKDGSTFINEILK